METMGQSGMGMGTGSMAGSSMGSMTRPRITQAHASAVLRVEDYQRAMRFYRDMLGFEVMDMAEGSGPGYGIVRAGDGTMFEIYERPGMPAPQNTTLDLLVQDFDATVQELRDRGVRFEEYDLPEIGLKTVNGVAQMGDTRAVWFKDTEGNIIALAEVPARMADMMGEI